MQESKSPASLEAARPNLQLRGHSCTGARVGSAPAAKVPCEDASGNAPAPGYISYACTSAFIRENAHYSKGAKNRMLRTQTHPFTLRKDN